MLKKPRYIFKFTRRDEGELILNRHVVATFEALRHTLLVRGDNILLKDEDITNGKGKSLPPKERKLK